MTDEQLRQLIAQLIERIERLEERLDRAEGTDATEAPAPAAPPVEPPPVIEPPPIIQAPPTRPPPLPPKAPAKPPPAAPPGAPPVEPPPPPKPPPIRRPPTRPPAPVGAPRLGATFDAPPVPPRPRRSWEQIIGGKLAAWVGAFVVFIAAVFLVKLGYDSEWWGTLPTWARCLLVAGLGLLLVVGGEVALRRFGRGASVGLFGAGLAVLYLDAFATFQYFDLLSKEWAFALMALVAVGGFALTWHTRFRTIGILSLIGGYITPIMFRSSGGHEVEVGAFLTMLLAIALGLSATRGEDFRLLRFFALGGQIVMGLLWVANVGGAHWAVTIVFTSIWWSMLLAESVFAALRDQSPRGNPVTVLLATAAYVTAGTWILNGAGPGGTDWLGLFTVAIAALSAAAALQFGPGLDGLRGRLRSPMDKLAVALWAQAGVLLIVAVAQQFDGFGQSVSWLAIAVASIEVGRRLPSRGVDIFGLVVGGLALVRIGLVDSFFSPTMDTVRVEFAGVKVTDWAILVLIAVLALHVAAHRIRGGITPLWGTVAPATLAALGALGWLIVTAVQCDGYAGTTAWLAGTLILLALSPLAIRERYLEIALMLLLATGARWLLVDAIAERLDTGWNPDDMLPWINPQMGLALGIAATGVWATRAMNVRARVAEIVPRVTTGWAVVLLLGIIFLLVGASFEVDRLVERLATGGVSWAVGHVRQLLLTMLWALGSVGIGLLARTLMASSPDGGPGLGAVLLRRFAWAMLAACIVKWLLGDTLYWSVFGDPRGARALSQLVNVQMIVALVLGGGAITLWAMRGRGAATDPLAPIAMGAPVAAAVVVLWGLSFEIDRVIGQLSPDQEAALLFDPWHLRALWWTGLWAAGGFVMTWLGNRRSLASLAPSGWLIIIVSAIAWLTWDTLAWRIFDGRVDATVFLNLQCGVGVLLIVLIAAAMLVRRTTPVDDRAVALPPEKVRLVGYTAIALLGLWLGSLEIDRLPVSEPMARQAGLSVYWAIYGVALVVLGFVRNAAAARYAGLALLTITIAKVLLVDLATIGKTWRVLSALVSGLLLIGTSILYTRLSPQLLGRERDPDDEDETVP